MADQPQITVAKAAWDEQARADLSRVRVFGLDAVLCYREAVQAGQMTLFAVLIGGERRGSMVLKWRQQDRGGVVFCEALAVDAPDTDRLIGRLVDLVADWANSLGAVAIQFETVRKGLAKVCEAEGFHKTYLMERAV